MPKRFFSLAYLVLVLLINGCVSIPRQIISLPTPAEPLGVYHIVGSGQTLWRIAKIYNADVNQIMRINHIPDPNQLGVGQRLFIPQARYPLSPAPVRPGISISIEQLVGAVKHSSRWRAITIHHSATLRGNAESFDRNHRKRGMGGLFYHFVIGNGTASADGQIEVGWRWRKQVQVNRPYEIQICLVGDFDRENISSRQFDSLIKLITVLRRQYNIPLSGIRKHQDVTRKATDCPGEKLPFRKIIEELRKARS